MRVLLNKGKLVIEESVIDGDTMELISTGEVDLINKKIDLKILSAPLKTVDRVFKKTPILRTIFAGSLVAIPIHVKGDFDNPTVKILPIGSVGSGLLGMMKRIVTLPVTVVQPAHRKEQADQAPAE
jgi:hypothetical protein